jgi:NAD(P)H-hydrate epimerase
MKILSASDMSNWERGALDAGATTESLMEQAAAGCLKEIQRHFPAKPPVWILCGKGNNGNDGLWLAGLLRRLGWTAETLLTHPPAGRKPVDSAAVALGLENAHVWPGRPPDPAEGTALVLVDALLGLGASGKPRPPVSEMLEWAKERKKPRDTYVSIDFPSGMDPDTGEVEGAYFPADATLAIGAIKKGCVTEYGLALCGKILEVPLRMPAGLAEPAGIWSWFDQESAGRLVRPIGAHAHKRANGIVGLWAGAPGMAGAAVLASRAALRAGAGLARLHAVPEVTNIALSQTPELMSGSSPDVSEEAVFALTRGYDAVVIGPGLGRSPVTANQFKRILSQLKKPAVLDADALYHLAADPGLLNLVETPLVLTPHAGEMKRLLGKDFTERLDAVREWTQRHPGTVLVLKGPATRVATSGQAISLNASGNRGMATGGTGDALAGVIGALLASGYSAWDAARLGVWWHGRAGDHAAAQHGERSLLASDLIEKLGAAWVELAGSKSF